MKAKPSIKDLFKYYSEEYKKNPSEFNDGRLTGVIAAYSTLIGSDMLEAEKHLKALCGVDRPNFTHSRVSCL